MLLRSLLILVALGGLAGCVEFEHFPPKGGERCDPLWDRIDYKECYEDNLQKSGQMPPPGVREETPPEESFGNCSPEDLANHTCH